MKTYDEDIDLIMNEVNWDNYIGKTFFITGSTGLIGSLLTKTLIKKNIKVILLVRNKQKAYDIFGEKVDYVEGNIENIPTIAAKIDYIVHLASPTSSSFFASNPAETLSISIKGTMNVLDIAKAKKIKGMIYTSSMEVYGYPKKGSEVFENSIASFKIDNPRNSYPISKISCEMLCVSYAKEYSIPIKIARLTQTFGPGVNKNDARIFAEFMQSVLSNNNIRLHTKGETERCYVYTADAVSALLCILNKGKSGEAYNVANPNTYCTIKEMAELVANRWRIRVEYDGLSNNAYADTLFMKLNVDKLMQLGWKPRVGLLEMYERMIKSYYETYDINKAN